MKTIHLTLFCVLLALPACLPHKPEISLPEVPAAELVQALEQRRQTFSGLKAVASVQAQRKGRKRTYDSVGILLRSGSKFRIEAYGPLGQSLLVLVWDGNDMLLRMAGDDIIRPGRSGLERLLGAGIDGADLCAVLSGNVPAVTVSSEAHAFCGTGGVCVVEFRQGDMARRVWVTIVRRSAGAGPTITSYEVYRSHSLLFRARFEDMETISGYTLPRRVFIENPDKNASLNIEYAERDVNVPIDDAYFTLSAGETAAP